jgi:hypothetical protein
MPTLFRVYVKYITYPIDAQVGRFTDVNALPNSDEDNLWCTFDITIGLDDGYEFPADDTVVEHLEKWYGR